MTPTTTPTHLKIFFWLTTVAYVSSFFLPFDRMLFINLLQEGASAVYRQSISINEWPIVFSLFLPVCVSPIYFLVFWKTTLFHWHKLFKLFFLISSLVPLCGLTYFLFKRESLSENFMGAYIWIIANFTFFILYWLRIRHWQKASHQLEISDHLLDQD